VKFHSNTDQLSLAENRMLVHNRYKERKICLRMQTSKLYSNKIVEFPWKMPPGKFIVPKRHWEHFNFHQVLYPVFIYLRDLKGLV